MKNVFEIVLVVIGLLVIALLILGMHKKDSGSCGCSGGDWTASQANKLRYLLGEYDNKNNNTKYQMYNNMMNCGIVNAMNQYSFSELENVLKPLINDPSNPKMNPEMERKIFGNCLGVKGNWSTSAGQYMKENLQQNIRSSPSNKSLECATCATDKLEQQYDPYEVLKSIDLNTNLTPLLDSIYPECPCV